MISILIAIPVLIYAATVQKRTLALGFMFVVGWLVRGGLAG